MPLTQTALSMYKEQILCFLMEKVDILGTALWRCTILEGVSKNIGGGGGDAYWLPIGPPLNSLPQKDVTNPHLLRHPHDTSNLNPLRYGEI